MKVIKAILSIFRFGRIRGIPLRWQFTVILALVALLPALLVTGITLREVRSLEEEKILERLERIAEIKEEALLDWFEDRRLVLTLFAENISTRHQLGTFVEQLAVTDRASLEITRESVIRFFQNAVNAQSFYEEFFLIDLSGKVLASSSPENIDLSLALPPHQGLSQSFPLFSVRNTEPKPSISLLSPLFGPEDELLGLIGGRFELGGLLKILQQAVRGGSISNSYLVSKELRVRIPSVPLDRSSSQFSNCGIEFAMSGENGRALYLKSDHTDVRVFGVYRWLPELRSALLVELDESVGLQAFTRLRKLTLFVMVLVVLIAIVVGLIGANSLTEPLTHLTQLTKTLASETTQFSNGQTAPDEQKHREPLILPTLSISYEVDQLAQAFQTMAQEVTRSHSAIQHYAATLEEKVRERTAALEETNVWLRREIEERRRTEEQLQQSLQDKEVLLKEIHHRVKNNMQIVSSLLNLQAQQVPHLPSKLLFEESQSRIKSMALIHEQLYQSEDFTQIDFQEYIRLLVQELQSSYHGLAANVHITIDVQDIHLGIDTAIPCGLIINELVSNAFKHAFQGAQGRITIRLTQRGEGAYELLVGDDGIGLPKNLNINELDSLGLQIVKGLVEEQLDGTFTVDGHHGTAWNIKFQQISA